ncbi:MAG: hypothetical protein E7231_08840 [Cellulosilyticum sp.]|nr:hypothetical protein [Cellulosilyticum sp.]
MQLVELYESYKEESKNYMDWVETLVEKDFEGYGEDVIMAGLEVARDQFNRLMEESNVLEISPEEEGNYKDLRYLLMDHLFLASDLAHFYKCKELGRFKMRVLNNVNKRRRAEMFGSTAGSGSCPIR